MNIADTITAFFFRRHLRGQTRIHQLLLQGRRIEVKSKHGVRFQLDPYEYVDGFILHYGFYEEEVLEAALESLLPGDVFWDVGSNLGLHALTARRLRPDVSVWAFEPNPQMAALLVAAARRNAIEVTLLELALDATAGQADFFLHEGNSGRCGLHNWEADPRLQHIEVVTDTADGVVANHRAPAPNVVKIDVEGNEERVLAGMQGVLKSETLHTVIFEDSPQETSAVKTILREEGFTIEKLVRREPAQHNLENYVAKRNRASA